VISTSSYSTGGGGEKRGGGRKKGVRYPELLSFPMQHSGEDSLGGSRVQLSFGVLSWIWTRVRGGSKEKGEET